MGWLGGFGFVALGAAGFGIGGALLSVGTLFPLAGAVGGAALGLALGDLRRTALLALLGAVGITLGLIAMSLSGSFVYELAFVVGAVIGAVTGASLGLAFWDLRKISVLASSGAFGFGVGIVIGETLRHNSTVLRPTIAAGIIGGVFLGAALAYLEDLEMERPRPRRSRPR